MRLTPVLASLFALCAPVWAGLPAAQPGDAALSRIDRHVVNVPPQAFVALDSVCAGQQAALSQAFPHGFPLGIGSGLRLLKQDAKGLTLLTLTDRGPNGDVPAGLGKNGKTFAVPTYAPQAAYLRVDAHGARLTAVQPFRHPNGALISGLPLPAGMVGSTGEQAVNACLEPLAGDPGGLDPEGIDIDAEGKWWISDEYGPFLARIEPKTGRLIDLAAPGAGLPEIIQHRQPNRGFEGVAVADGKVYAIVQSTLDDIPDPARPDDKQARSKRHDARFLRLVEYDPRSRTSRTFAYPHDVAERRPDNGADGAYAKSGDAKIGDLVALGKGRFALIEQGKGANKVMRNVLYTLDISRATPIDALTVDGKPLEFASDRAQLRAAGVRLIEKTRLLDLHDYGWQAEKAEGLAVIGRDTLAVINDNDFGMTSNADDREAFPKGQPVDAARYRITPNDPHERATQLWLLKFARPLR